MTWRRGIMLKLAAITAALSLAVFGLSRCGDPRLAIAMHLAEQAGPSIPEGVASFYTSGGFAKIPTSAANSSNARRMLLAVIARANPPPGSRVNLRVRYRNLISACLGGPLMPEDRAEVVVALSARMGLGYERTSLIRDGSGQRLSLSIEQRAALRSQLGSPKMWTSTNWTALGLLADDGDRWIIQWIDQALPLMEAKIASDPNGQNVETYSGCQMAAAARERVDWALDADECWRRATALFGTPPTLSGDSFVWLMGRARTMGKPVETMRAELIAALEPAVLGDSPSAITPPRIHYSHARRLKALAIKYDVLRPTDAPSIRLTGLELVQEGCE